MKLLVDSGSTKADWIAIDDNGKVLFTTQTLGLNPEVLDREEIISRLDDKFDIEHNYCFLIFGCCRIHCSIGIFMDRNCSILEIFLKNF